MANGHNKMGDSDSLVDDPHEGWVIPYDQADDQKHVSIADKPSGKLQSDKSPLSQNMEDTRL